MADIADIYKFTEVDIDKYNKLEDIQKANFRKKMLMSLPIIDNEYFEEIADQKSSSLLSEWHSNVVRIFFPNERSKSKTIIIDLDNIFIQCSGPMSVFEGVLPLSTFPNIMDSCKAYLNKCAETFKESSKACSDVAQNFNNILRFMAWVIQQKGVYRFGSLSRDDFNEFINQYCNMNGWHRLLAHDKALANILVEIEAGKINIDEISTQTYNVFNLNISSIERVTGIVGCNSMMPAWFKKRLIALTGKSFTKERLGKFDPDTPVSYMRIYNVIKSLNRLYALPDRFDQPNILPFPNGPSLAIKKSRANKKHLKEYKGGEDGRTANLRLDDAIALLKLSLEWIYEYSDGVVELLKIHRERLEKYTPIFEKEKEKDITNFFKSANDIEKNKYDEKYRLVCKKYNLPFDTVVHHKQVLGFDPNRSPTLDSIVKILMSACFILIAINHGRRLNEIIGQNDLSYGLYFGCIQKGDNDVDFIDIYIEKTIQDWSKFYVNKLVKDAVNILEEISQIFRPLHTKRKNYIVNPSIARKDKLFKLKTINISSWYKNKYTSFIFSMHSKDFFQNAGVNIERIDHRAHPFRRFFALLYFYRYDNPRLLALQHHLRHCDPGTTVVYLSDPRIRNESDRIENLYKDKVNAHTKEEMGLLNDIRSQAFTDAVLEILSGERTGGGWPAIVLSMYKILSKRGDFDDLNLEERAKLTADKLQKRNYQRTPYEHGGCNNGSNNKTRRMSHCHNEEDDIRHTEDASQKKCQGCIHHDCSPYNIKILENNAKLLKKQLKDYSLPLVARKAAQSELNILLEMLNSEKELGSKNKQLINDVVGSFSEIIKQAK